MTPVLEQSMEALAIANQVRWERAEFKRGLKRDPATIFGLLEEPVGCVESASVREILSCLPRFGPRRVGVLCSEAGVNEFREFGSLTVRQRLALAEGLRQRGVAA